MLCAKVIAAIGLCHSFVNDPVLLKANNQEALTSSNCLGEAGEEAKGDPEGNNGPNVIKSDYHNPIINMKYGKEKSDHTLEFLAIPQFDTLPIERVDFGTFALRLKSIVTDLTLKTEEKPKNYYFTQYLLSRFITTQAKEQKSNEERGNTLTKDSSLGLLDQ